MILVESSGKDNAYNEGSGATGPLQIKQVLIDDINRIHNRNYNLEMCNDLAFSIRIFDLTMEHYATKERLGHKPTMRDRAGIWKQGFTGYKRNPHESYPYWAKILRYAEKLK